MAKSLYRKGDLVRGVPGRVSENWKGTVVEIREDGGVMVDWKERQSHENPLVRKTPVLFMLPEQLRPWAKG